ncbi:deoxyribose-phosphate aldolase [Lyngbya confervoides]|uniref:Deoxyribose-phosphate aldolase n=1 Tax=Lyngbya confervoides BDU141951 TaxID=1574623 RepID=A0ABD4T9J7_9CYAN|nr:deoxyribose-phosphate aldolase [Lyngbya confervoides]MCM1984987.1 deoxyribose-phosphate aldolase [Lyngbya confervoides BDU141951]
MAPQTQLGANFNVASYIEHTCLDPFASQADIEQLCGAADRYGFPAVCLAPCHVTQAVELLHPSEVQVCTVVGFPSGFSTPACKLYEAQEAVDLGAGGLDLVINLGLLRDQRLDELHREVAQICEATQVPVKAILEMARLSPTQKRLAAEVCMDAGVAFLKTSTGWFGGATVADVEILHQVGRDRVGIKAAGGIQTYDQALALIQAGATRLGTSRGVEIVQGQDEQR